MLERYIEEFSFFKKKKKESFVKKWIFSSLILKYSLLLAFYLIYFKIFGVYETINLVSYVLGLYFGVKGTLKSKEFGEPNVEKVSLIPMVKDLMLSMIFLALPSLLVAA